MDKSTKEFRPLTANKNARPKDEPLPARWKPLQGDPLERLCGQIEACGDIISPVVAADEWESVRDDGK